MNDPRSTDPHATDPHGSVRRPEPGADESLNGLPDISGEAPEPAAAGMRQPPDFQPEPTAAPAQPVRPANLDFGFGAGAFERALGDTSETGGRPVPPPVVRPRLPPRPAAQGQSERTPAPPRPPAPGAVAPRSPATPVRPAAPRPVAPPRPAAAAPAAPPPVQRRPVPPPVSPDFSADFDDDLDDALTHEIRGTVPPVSPAPVRREPPPAVPPRAGEPPKAAIAPVSRGPAARVLGTESGDEDAEGFAPPFEPLPPIERAATRRTGAVRQTMIDTPPVPEIEELPMAVPDPMQQDFSQDFGLSPFDLAGATPDAARPRKPAPRPAPASAALPEADDFDDDQAYATAFDNAIADWRDEPERRTSSAETLDETVADHNFVDAHDDEPTFPPLSDEPPARRRRRSPVLWIGTTIVIVILIGLVGYYATEFFGSGLSDAPPPVVKAEDGPVKVEPPPSTAAETSDPSKVFYDRVAETNKAENQTLDQPAGNAEGAAQQNRPGDAELPGVPSAQPQPAGQNAGAPQAVVPRKVRTVVVRPDGTIITPDPTQAAEAAAEQAAQARDAAAGQSAPVPALSPQQETTAEDPLATMNYITPGKFVMPKPRPDNSRAALDGDGGAPAAGADSAPVQHAALSPPADDGGTAAASGPGAGNEPGAAVTPPLAVAGNSGWQVNGAAPQAEAPQVAVPQVAAATEVQPAPEAAPPAPEAASVQEAASVPETASVAAPANDAVPSAAAGDAADAPFGVQVASQKSHADAEKAFAALKRRFPAVLGNATPTIVTARLGDRGTFYRVRVGAPTAAAANTLCSRLKAAGGSCFVVRS